MLASRPPLVLKPQPFPDLHLKGTTGARHVRTPNYLKTYRAIEDAHRIKALVAIIGAPGLGKTHDCGLCIRRLGFRPAYYPVGPKSVGKEFETLAIHSLAQEMYNRNNTKAEMKRDLRWAASTYDVVWTLDDVERAEGYGIEFVRHLWAQPNNQFTIILVGNNLMQFLDANPALKDRVARWVHYRPMSPEESVVYAKDYHPIYEGAPEEVVEYAENEAAHGVARQWAHLTEAILSDGFDHRTEKLTRSRVDEAIAVRFQL